MRAREPGAAMGTLSVLAMLVAVSSACDEALIVLDPTGNGCIDYRQGVCGGNAIMPPLNRCPNFL